MTNDQADSAFESLHNAQKAAQFLYMDLRDAGNVADAASAKLRADRLQNEIDNLINRELADWQAGAEALLPQLSAAASAAQIAVDGIEQDVQNAKNVVSAMQTLDNVIGVAMKFIG
jgi:hypothetical protein